MPLPHVVQLLFQAQPAGILLVPTVDHVAKRLCPLSRVIQEPDRAPAFAIDHGRLLAPAQIRDGLRALRGSDAIEDAAAIAALVEPEHQSRLLRRAAVHERIDAEGAMGAHHARGSALLKFKTRPPHQRAVGKNPEIAAPLVDCCAHPAREWPAALTRSKERGSGTSRLPPAQGRAWEI